MQGFEFSGVKRWGLKIEPVIATSVDCLVFFLMGSFPTAVQQEFLYQEEPVVGASAKD